ncbi:MAG: phytanoyl-CoA dioxygenase family protein [Candidatus Obscuribacterales bacterium]|nr:phytanoyl-CoA dioxygenase family protein [Candidatus Obscuribacterales bacterium]
MSKATCLTESSATNEIRTKGYFVEKNLLNSDEIKTIESLMPNLIEEDITRFGSNKYYSDHGIAINLMFRGDIFRQVMTKPKLIEVVDSIMGETSILNAYNAPSTPPGGSNSAKVIHTDCPPERVIPGFITNLNLVIAISPFTKDKGATFYYPGSQEMLSAPSEDDFYRQAEQVELEPGDAIFFNAHIWHAAGVNQTEKTRYGLGMNFIKSYMRQRFDFPRMTSPELEKRLTALERRLLGFNVRVPASLEEFYVEPEKRLYLAKQG